MRHPGTVDSREPAELAACQIGQFGVREHAHFAPINLPRSRKVNGPEVTRAGPYHRVRDPREASSHAADRVKCRGLV